MSNIQLEKQQRKTSFILFAYRMKHVPRERERKTDRFFYLEPDEEIAG